VNILITGGSGFIGRNFVEYLSEKHNILAPTHNELELLDEDAVKRFFDNNHIDIVIHSAVRAGHRNAIDSSNQLYNNTRMFFNIERNKGKYKKLIFLGSGLDYDIRYYLPKMQEEYFDTHVPIDEGGFSKYIISKYIQNSDNMIELRIFGIFGKYEDYAIRFISNAICKTLFDLPITIKQNRLFDYIYIEDLMPVIDYFIANEVMHKVYNVTPNNPIELITLAQKILRVSGKDLPIVIYQEGMGTEYSGANSRLREQIPDLSFIPFDHAIQKLYNWYRQNKEIIDKNYLIIDK